VFSGEKVTQIANVAENHIFNSFQSKISYLLFEIPQRHEVHKKIFVNFVPLSDNKVFPTVFFPVFCKRICCFVTFSFLLRIIICCIIKQLNAHFRSISAYRRRSKAGGALLFE
jgi:hypothetical protein